MANLIPQIELKTLAKLGDKIKELKSCEVMLNGEFLFTAIIPPIRGGPSFMANVRSGAEGVAYSHNTIGGLSLEEVQQGKKQ